MTRKNAIVLVILLVLIALIIWNFTAPFAPGPPR